MVGNRGGGKLENIGLVKELITGKALVSIFLYSFFIEPIDANDMEQDTRFPGASKRLTDFGIRFRCF